MSDRTSCDKSAPKISKAAMTACSNLDFSSPLRHSHQSAAYRPQASSAKAYRRLSPSDTPLQPSRRKSSARPTRITTASRTIIPFIILQKNNSPSIVSSIYADSLMSLSPRRSGRVRSRRKASAAHPPPHCGRKIRKQFQIKGKKSPHSLSY